MALCALQCPSETKAENAIYSERSCRVMAQKKTNIDRKCYTCLYYEEAHNPDIKDDVGLCHRYPPLHCPESRVSVNGLRTFTDFPLVLRDWWCGEWFPKEVKNE